MRINKKYEVINELFKSCMKNNNYEFHNDLVKEICKNLGFGNPFDVTKLDNKNKLPKLLLEHDYSIIHLGNGHHKFLKGINKIFHDFEEINNEVDWGYKKSLLNQFNSSESNILSIANNQRILHHFLFDEDKEFLNDDIVKRPKTYFPHRTKTSFNYNYGKSDDGQIINVSLKNIQIEVDLTIEFDGKIGIFEAKNGKSENFNVYQLYHPFLYYYNAKEKLELKDKIKEIICVYVVRKKFKNFDSIKMWAYNFENPYDITSIKLIKACNYKLINENE